MSSTPKRKTASVPSAPVKSPSLLQSAGGLLALVGLHSSAGPALAGSLDAGASTFESASRRYAPEPIRLEDIRVPHVEPKPAAAAAQEGPAFAIDRFEVTGNTLLTPSQVDAVVDPFRGPSKTFADVEAARAALAKRYEADGFLTVSVEVPRQTVESGTVRLDVVEGRIGRVDIRNDGRKWVSDRRIEGSLEHIVPGAVLRQDDFIDDMNRVNRSRDARVRPELSRGEKEGDVDVGLVVDDRIPLHASLAWHNDHTSGSPETRMDATASYSNLWGLGHEAGVFYQFVPTNDFSDVQIWAGSYRAPMPWNEEQQLFVYYANSDTKNAAATGGGLAILGKGQTTGFRFDMPLPRPEAWTHFSHGLTFGADYKDIENDVAAPGVELVTPIKYLPFLVAWSGTRAGDHAITNARVGLAFNFAGMVDGGSTEDFQINRGGIDPNSPVDGDYKVVSLSFGQILRVPSLLTTLAAGRFVDLPKPTKGFVDDWTFEVRARGQIADQPLVATEQFGAGGVDTVQGYLDREKTGDNAYLVQLELHTPAYQHFLGGRFGERIQALLFWNDSRLWLLGDPTSDQIRSRLESYGIGLRAGLFDNFSAELSVAQPIIETEDSSGPRLHFRIALGF
jgi:hemolysin activation/secretion protein